MKIKLLFIFSLLSSICNGQNFWTEVAPFPDNYGALEISIANQNVVWVRSLQDNLNIHNRWARSEDGGVTWFSGDLDFGNPALEASNIQAISATQAYAAAFATTEGVYGGVWVTQDSGATWTKQESAAFNEADSFVNFVYFWNENIGVIVGDPTGGVFQIYTTTDGGDHWNTVPSADIPAPLTDNEYALTRKYEARDNVIRFGTTKGRIFSSADFGHTWSVVQSPITDFSTASFSFKNNNEGLIVTEDRNLYKTSDNGQNWSLATTPNELRDHEIIYVPGTTNTFFSSGPNASGQRGCSYSLNGGQNWISLDDVEGTAIDISAVKFYSSSVGFCIGSYLNDFSGNARFFRLTDPLNRLSGALAVTSFEPGSIQLTPNPTQGFVRILGTDIETITVSDLSGKILKSFASFPVGEIHLDLSALQNGMYLLKITTTQGESESKKIIKN